MVDLGEQVDGSELFVVFVEVVASDGPVHAPRKKALTDIATQACFELSSLRFLAAFEDRADPAFKKAVSELAWDTAAWFVSEPDKVVLLESLVPSAA